MAKPIVVRVSGIEGDEVESEKDWLHSIIASSLEPDESGNFEIEIVPSCDDESRVALVDFRHGLPRFLNASLKDDELPVHVEDTDRCTLTFDCHFHGLTQMYPTPANQAIIADIVAVTGLDGHAYGSWRGKKFGKMWLRHFLRRDLPRCRTMIFGYNSRLSIFGHHTLQDYNQGLTDALSRARANAEEAKRPIIFIGHSFGGLIITHCLLESIPRNRFDSTSYIYQCTYAILFFGTPHRGLSKENVENIKTMIAEGNPRLELLERLAPGHDLLVDQVQRFINISPEFKIVSYSERVETSSIVLDPTTGKPVRSGSPLLAADSGTSNLHLPLSSEARVYVDKNHSEMVKYESNSDATYKDIRSRLAKYVTAAPQAIKEKFTEGLTSMPSYRLPPSG